MGSPGDGERVVIFNIKTCLTSHIKLHYYSICLYLFWVYMAADGCTQAFTELEWQALWGAGGQQSLNIQSRL